MKMSKNIIILIFLIILGVIIFWQLGKQEQSRRALPINANHEMVGTNPGTYTPKYVEIKGFKQCIDLKVKDNYSVVCIPSQKPKKCTSKAWQELSKLNLEQC